MAESKITLIGFYNYYKAVNKDIFSNLSLPTGIDKDIVINNILLKGGEFEVLFSNPEFLENMISLWSNKYRHTFERWYLALTEEYNPLHNFDRHEEYNDKRIEGETYNRNTSGTESGSKGENVTALDHSLSSGTGETTNGVSAYDSGTYSNHDKSNSASTGENSSTATTNVTGSDSRSTSGTDNSNKFLNSNLDHNAHLYGNIGLTTSQQMATDEVKLRRDFNIYDLIADLFISEFCIYTY